MTHVERQGEVVLLDEDGTALWRVAEPASDAQASPVLDGLQVYCGGRDGVVSRARADGDLLWQVPVPVPVYGLWAAGDLVVVVGGQAGVGGQAVGIDAATGSARWRHRLPGRGLLGDQVLTGNGGLAWSLDDNDRRTQVMDLQTGTVRWTSTARGQAGALTAGGGLVLRGEDAHVTAYDSLDGRALWRSEELTGHLHIQLVEGLAVLSQSAYGAGLDGSMCALRLVDGTTAWTLRDSAALATGGSGAGRVVVHTRGIEPRFGLLDLTDGRVRWWVDSQIALHVPAIVTHDAVLTVEGGTVDQQRCELLARSVLSGGLLWRVDVPDTHQAPVTPAHDRVRVLGRSASDPEVADVTTRRISTGEPTGRATVRGWVSRPGDGIVLQGADPLRAIACERPASTSPGQLRWV